jgi:hypothetical protein
MLDEVFGDDVGQGAEVPLVEDFREEALDQFVVSVGHRRRHYCIERARRGLDGRESSDGRFVRPGIDRLVQFTHTISLAGRRGCVRFASNATVPRT